MKKLILPFVALLIGMAACQKEDTNVLTLEVEHYNGDAKMHIDNQDFAVWDDGDTVWLNENPRRVNVDNDNHRATMSAQDVISPYYASYPYNAEESGSTAGKKYTISLPEVQKYRENSQGQQIVAAPMFAYCGHEETTLTFRNIGSVLAVKVMNYTYDPLSVHSIQVTADNQNLWGEKTSYVHDINTFALDNLTNDNNNGKTVTLNCGDGVEVPAEGKVFYIALPTISGTHLTVKVDDGYGIYTLAQTTNTATFARNTLHQVPFKATDDIYEVRSLRQNMIRYTATSKLNGFEENTTVWEKTVVRHDYNETTQQGTIKFNSAITEIPNSAFYYNSALLSIELPESVETIKTDGFYECRNLASVSMPGVRTIGNMAFAYCSALTTLNLPSVTGIENSAFCYSGIQTITFGPNLGRLEFQIFAFCSNITDIYCKAQNPPECAQDVSITYYSEDITNHSFAAMDGSPILHVPSGSGQAYTRHSIWHLAFGNTWGPGTRILEDCPE